MTVRKFSFPPLYLLLLFLPVLLPLSCRPEEDTRPGFDMVFQEQFEIPAGITPFVVHHFTIDNLPSNYQKFLSMNGKTDADISGIVTTQAVLSGIYGDENYDFIEQVSVRVYQASDPTDFLEVAYRQPVPLDPGNHLPLIPSLADSKDLLSNDLFSVEVVLWLRKTTQDNIPTKLELQFKALYQ